MALEIKDNGTYVHLRFIGQVSATDFKVMGLILERIEAGAEAAPSRVVDLTEADKIMLNFRDVESFARSRRTAQPKGRLRSALVVNSPLQFGFMRMYQALDDHPMIATAIFWNRESALQWLRDGVDVAREALPEPFSGGPMGWTSRIGGE